jgi:RNA-directed DNA polymerase
MSPEWEPGFSESSYGFRPGRSAHQAVEAARGHIASGRHWVVDIDLEKFFDRVNHDVLMARVARRISDKRLLGLIRRYLQSGIMAGGLTQQRLEGTPQGGPLSPLLSNILLDDLDKELERRGHRFCRYADDCNVYVRSQRAGERVMESLKHFLMGKLRLKINESKSRVERPWKTKFLGYSTLEHCKEVRLIVADESTKRFKVKVRTLFRHGRGRNLEWFIKEDLNPLLRGWANYYRKSVQETFKTLDQWIRRKLRCLVWRQWARPYTRAHRLMNAGYTSIRAWQCAYNGRGPWRNAATRHMNHACPNAAFERMGLVSMLATVQGHA